MNNNLTIFIPTYNSSSTICETLHSLEEQLLPPIKIIVSDNNSTDNTLEIIKQNFVNIEIVINPDSLFFINKSNTEKALSNFNFINKICNTDYFCICHSDDVYEKNFTYELLKELSINTSCSAIFCRSKRLNNKFNFLNNYTPRNILFYFLIGKKIILDRKKLLYYSILFGNIIEAPSAMFRKNKLINLKYNNKFDQAADLDFYFQCTNESNIILYNEKLYRRRYHELQDSHNGKYLYFTNILPFYNLIDYTIKNNSFFYSNYIYDIYFFNKNIDQIIANNGLFIKTNNFNNIEFSETSIISKIYVFLIFPKSILIYFSNFINTCLNYYKKKDIINLILQIFKTILLR